MPVMPILPVGRIGNSAEIADNKPCRTSLAGQFYKRAEAVGVDVPLQSQQTRKALLTKAAAVLSGLFRAAARRLFPFEHNDE